MMIRKTLGFYVVITIVILTENVILVDADAGSWLSWSWSQAQYAGKEAGSALYKGNEN